MVGKLPFIMLSNGSTIKEKDIRDFGADNLVGSLELCLVSS